MSDPYRLPALAHRDLPFANPVATEQLDALLAQLDVGCGNGELPRRVAARASPHALACFRVALQSAADGQSLPVFLCR